MVHWRFGVQNLELPLALAAESYVFAQLTCVEFLLCRAPRCTDAVCPQVVAVRYTDPGARESSFQ